MEINIAEYNQKKFDNFNSAACFVECFLIDDKIPFRIEVDNDYQFVLTYACSNRQFQGESE